METKFQTSFIPRKPLSPTGGAAGIGLSAQHPKHTRSIFLDLAILLFILSLGAAGGIFAWKSILLSNQETYKKELATRQEHFDPELIEKLQHENVKIDAARGVLSRHVALSNIFDIISRMTVENVRFLGMEVSVPPDQSTTIKFSLTGYSKTLPTLAFQSDVLAKLADYGLAKIVKNPALTDPTINENGLVSFGFSASIDPATLLYEKSISSPPGSEPEAATSTAQ